jgi:hypothetical protein
LAIVGEETSLGTETTDMSYPGHSPEQIVKKFPDAEAKLHAGKNRASELRDLKASQHKHDPCLPL